MFWCFPNRQFVIFPLFSLPTLSILQYPILPTLSISKRSPVRCLKSHIVLATIALSKLASARLCARDAHRLAMRVCPSLAPLLTDRRDFIKQLSLSVGPNSDNLALCASRAHNLASERVVLAGTVPLLDIYRSIIPGRRMIL